MDVLGEDSRETIGRRAQSRSLLVVMLFASVTILASSLYSAEASVFSKARASVVDATAPALKWLAQPFAFLQDRFGDIREYFNVLEQNKSLRQENAELRVWMADAIKLRAELKSYKRLQAFAADVQTTPIDAFVIAESNDTFSKSMLVDAGASDGVRRGMAVVDGTGLLGRIVEVGKRSSRILLLTDVQSGVPVYVESSGLEGILKGRTGGRPYIDFAASNAPVKFQPNDEVVTSGAGGALPRGILVGRIIREKNGRADVALAANYVRARIVRVVNYQFPAFETSPIQDDPSGPSGVPKRSATLPLQPPPGPLQGSAQGSSAQGPAQNPAQGAAQGAGTTAGAPKPNIAPGLAPDAPPPAAPNTGGGDD